MANNIVEAIHKELWDTYKCTNCSYCSSFVYSSENSACSMQPVLLEECILLQEYFNE